MINLTILLNKSALNQEIMYVHKLQAQCSEESPITAARAAPRAGQPVRVIHLAPLGPHPLITSLPTPT